MAILLSCSPGAWWDSATAWAETPGGADDTEPESVEEVPDFHKLSNEEFLEKIEGLLWTSLQDFRAEMRGLSKSQLLFKQAQTESEAFHLPEDGAEQVVSESKAPLEDAEAKASHAKARHDALQQQVRLIQAEKQRLEAQIEQIEQARLAADSFAATLGQLELPLLELELRLEDESLTLEKVPPLLQAESLEAQRLRLAQQREWLEELATSTPISLKLIEAGLKEAQKDALEAEVEHATAEKHHAEEMKRQELLQTYKGQTPEGMMAELPDLQEELIGLSGTLQLAHRGFVRRQAEVEKLEQQIEALTIPEAAELIRPGQTVRTDEVEKRSEQVNEVLDYYDQRIGQTQALHTALTALIKDGEAYLGEAAVLNDHVFSVQVPVEILERAVLDGQVQADAIPEGLGTEQLSQMKARAAAVAEDAHTAVEQAKQHLLELSDQIEKTQAVRQEAETYLKQLQHQAVAAEKTRRWAAEVKELAADQVAARFKEAAQSLKANSQSVLKVRKAYREAKELAEEEQLHFDSLTDPLLRAAQHDAVAEKHDITRKLYAFAGLELPAELKAVEASTATDKLDQEGPSDTDQYQNLLTSRMRIIGERADQRDKLKEALSNFKSQIAAYEKVLGEADGLLQQQYTNAVELKKRIGRGQLSDDGIPEGITEALNRERIEETESDLADLIQEEAEVQQQIEHLGQPSDNVDKIRAALEETLTSVGRRLDVTNDLEKLEAVLKRTAADRTEVEAASVAQNAARRLAADESREERFYAYVPSTEADEVTNLMKVYYQEFLDLKSRQANLQAQAQLTERLILLAESEKVSVTDLLPLIQQEEAHLDAAEERAWIVVEAGLVPDKAEELLSAYERKTGERLPTPPPVDPEEREAAIAAGTELLFDRHTAVVAAQKWTQLFGQRLSEDGVDREIGAFQDQLGAITADHAAIQRAINRLAGQPEEELSKLDEADAPKTEAERQLFLHGEIGALRVDRQKIRQQAIFEILIRLAMIVAAALVLTLIVSAVIGLMSRRYRSADVDSNAQTLLVLSFLKATIRSVIWISAIILILSTIGFNVGAILAGLGIGGLAIAMAARETLADIIGGIMIFMERPFVIGDTIQVAGGSPGKVVDMTWRTTKLLGTTTYYTNVPNSQVANSHILNYSRDKPICDWVTLYVSAEHAPEKIVEIANRAISECDMVIHEPDFIGTSIGGVTELGNQTVMWYWPWWYIDDYHRRGGIRGDVWALLWKHMTAEGIELDIKPIELQEDRHPDMEVLARSSSEE